MALYILYDPQHSPSRICGHRRIPHKTPSRRVPPTGLSPRTMVLTLENTSDQNGNKFRFRIANESWDSVSGSIDPTFARGALRQMGYQDSTNDTMPSSSRQPTHWSSAPSSPYPSLSTWDILQRAKLVDYSMTILCHPTTATTLE